MVVRSGPPFPPRPVAPWQDSQLFAKTIFPAAALAAEVAPPAPACSIPPPLPGAAAGPSLPSSPKSHRLSPCEVAASALPPERNATYSLPFIWKIVEVLVAPAPVGKLQSCAPV